MRLLVAFCLFIGFYSSFASAEKIRLATLNWEPFYGESLPESGFYANLTVEAFNRAGYEVELHFINWKRAVENAKNGTYDGLMGAYFTEERTQHFVFTDVIYNADESFITTNRKNIAYQSVADLKPYIIGGLRASAPLVELSEIGYRIDETTAEVASLQKLLLGRIDVVLMGKAKFFYDVQNDPKISKRAEEFLVLEPPYKTFEMFNTISKKRKDAEEIVDGFNKALALMKSDGTYDAILEKFNMK